MATRSLNRVQLIGNLTRDPELRYTPQGTAVANFGVATNRQWTTEDGQKHDEAEFHNIVVWNKLAEIVAEFLKKGRQVYVEGRLATREWEGQDGAKRRTTEIVASEVIFLGGSPQGAREEGLEIPPELGDELPEEQAKKEEKTEGEKKEDEKEGKGKKQKSDEQKSDEGEDIPF